MYSLKILFCIVSVSTVQDDHFPRGVHENNITYPMGQINRDVILNKFKQSVPRLHYTNINYYIV